MAAARSPRGALPGRAGLSVVQLNQQGDGIAYVARLLHRALGELGGAPPAFLELAPRVQGLVTRGERLRFFARLAAAQVAGPADWWLFNHLGIARALDRVPAALRRPHAVMVNGIEAWDPALAPDRKRVLAGAAGRIAISHHTAARVAAVHPDVGPITPCPLGLLPACPVAEGEVDRELVGAVGRDAVVIVGRMSAAERYKGHDLLLECWPQVLERVPAARLVVAGRGDDRERLREKAAAAGLDDRVLFPGFVSDATLHHLFRRAGLFAMPSRGEGFGLVYLEAMRAGLPCIGSRADAAIDLIVHGETGFLVDPANRAELAGSIARLLATPGEREAFGAAGLARFHAEFTYERFRDRLMGVLAHVFGAAGRGGR